MLQHRRQIGELRLDLVEWLRHGNLRGLAVKRMQSLALLFLGAGNCAQGLLQFLFEFFDGFLRRALLLRRPGIELRRWYHLAVVHRGHAEAHRRAQDRDVLRRRLFAQLGEGALVLRLDGLHDRAAALLVVLALEDRRQRGPQIVDQVVDHLLEVGCAPARQRDRHRPVRGCEIVDIHPVGRQRPREGGFLHQGFDELLGVGAARADGEYVEATLADFAAKADGFVRARLTDQPRLRREVRRGREFQPADVGGAIQAIGRQRLHRRGCGLRLSVWLSVRHPLAPCNAADGVIERDWPRRRQVLACQVAGQSGERRKGGGDPDACHWEEGSDPRVKRPRAGVAIPCGVRNHGRGSD